MHNLRGDRVVLLLLINHVDGMTDSLGHALSGTSRASSHSSVDSDGRNRFGTESMIKSNPADDDAIVKRRGWSGRRD